MFNFLCCASFIDSHQVFIGRFYMITSNGDDDNARVIAYVCSDSFMTQWKFHLRLAEMHLIFFKATINTIFFCIHLGKLQINWIDSTETSPTLAQTLVFMCLAWVCLCVSFLKDKRLALRRDAQKRTNACVALAGARLMHMTDKSDE